MLIYFRFKKPVRTMFDRKEDMVITCHRHPFYGKYKVGFNEDGKIKACEISLYCNAGCSKDLSDAVSIFRHLKIKNDCLD